LSRCPRGASTGSRIYKLGSCPWGKQGSGWRLAMC
jgi:hypothetical protein